MNRSQSKKQRAFTLPDVLVGALISVMLILGSLRLLIDSCQVESSTREGILASNAARQVVENLRGIKDAAFATGTYSDARTFGAVPQLAALDQGAVSAIILTSVGKAKKVAVTVTWRSSVQNRSKSWKLVTLVSPGGVSL